MGAAYWKRRYSDWAWDEWIEAVNSQWPVTLTHQSPLLQNTNGTYSYEYGQEFAVEVDAPSWIQARNYIEECLKPIFTDHYTIHPATQEGGDSKIAEELAKIGEKAESLAEDYAPDYPEIQFGASGRSETMGVIRIDISDAQLDSIINQASEKLETGNQPLFSPKIPLVSGSSRSDLEAAVEEVRGEGVPLQILDLSGDGEGSEPATASLVFLVSDTGARQLGNAIESIDSSEEESQSEPQKTPAETVLVYPELVATHTQDLIDFGTTALETEGCGVVGAIPRDNVPIDLEWVRNYGPPDPSITVRGFRSNFLREQDDDESSGGGVLESVIGDDDQEEDLTEQELEQVQEEIEAESEDELSEYRISLELAAADILAEQFDESYVEDVPINNFMAQDGRLHIPNPEFCIFIDVALTPDQEEELREKIKEIDLSERSAEIAVLKAPLEPNSIHQELIVEVFPHFKLVQLRDELRPLIEEVGGVIYTEELPYFVKYSAKEPYYITQDISSLSNPERKLTSEEEYYNDRRIELIHAQTDYRRILNAENLRLSLTEIKLGENA